MKNIKCKHCLYIWKTQSKLSLVTCPNCGHKTKITIGEKNEKEK